MNILFGDFNANVGREDIFKPTIGNGSSYEINNDNGVVNISTYKNLSCQKHHVPSLQNS
jgi:hypothetical protein